MARVYAQAADYLAYTGQTPPTTIEALLAQAARFLDANVFRLCWYMADQTTGMPTDPIVLQAFTDATCAQAQWWEELGDSIGAAGAGWGDIRIGSAQLSRLSSREPHYAGADSPAREVAPQVWDVLAAPDLTPHRFRIGEVRTWSGQGGFL